jgi:Fe-S cluster assembly iron-binding protein IscA
MIEISDAAREVIARTVADDGSDKAVRVYIAGHG